MLLKSTLNASNSCESGQTLVVDQPTPVVASDRALKKEFRELLANSGLTPRQLADASGCTLEAAKLWLTGKRLPSLVSILRMSQRLPVIRQWLQSKLGGTVPDMRDIIVAPQITPKQIPDDVIRDAFQTIVVRLTGPTQDHR